MGTTTELPPGLQPPDEITRSLFGQGRRVARAHPLAIDTLVAAVLLTVEAAAERLSTSSRFVRRLIAERRIEFVKVGRHVRISESALAEFIEAGRVEPITVRNYSRRWAA